MTKCCGCGVELQDKDIKKVGYVDNLNKKFCMRCFKLTNYGCYQKVELGNEEFIKIIDNISNNSLVVYMADLLSLNLSNLKKFKRVLLVITKKDILPKSVKDSKIIDYIKKRNINVIDVIVVSSTKNYNIDILYNKMLDLSNKNEIYLVGNTNTGKSTLLNKLIKNYKSDNIINNITVSMYPSTTLDKVAVKVGKLSIIDTPGLIDPTNIVNYVSLKDLKKINIKNEIKPKSCQIKGKGSFVIDKFARIDYDTIDNNSMIIYASNSLNTRFNNKDNNNLTNLPQFNFKLEKNQDIVIPGLCFIKFIKPIEVKVYTLDGVIPIKRDSLI